MSKKKKNSIITTIKMVVFLMIILLIARLAIVVCGNGKIDALEGYLYSFATSATDTNATSCDATSSDATSCDATSSNATSCDATSSNATSSNVATFNSEAIKQQQHLQDIQQVVEEKVEEPKLAEIVKYNNSELTSDLLTKLTESEDVKKIIINADTNAKISSNLFKTIQNKDKQLVIVYNENELVFNGKNITSLRDIDVSNTVETISSDSDVSNLLSSKGIVINFAPNGELPGVAKVRVKATSTLRNSLTGSQVYAYYYDEVNKNFTLMSQNVKLSDDGFYEFAIEHNSKYVLVNDKIDDTLLAGYIAPTNNNKKETVSFLETHKTYVEIIGLCVLAIILITIIIILDKKGIEKRKMKAEQERMNAQKAFRKDDNE